MPAVNPEWRLPNSAEEPETLKSSDLVESAIADLDCVLRLLAEDGDRDTMIVDLSCCRHHLEQLKKRSEGENFQHEPEILTVQAVEAIARQISSDDHVDAKPATDWVAGWEVGFSDGVAALSSEIVKQLQEEIVTSPRRTTSPNPEFSERNSVP